jgi:hypothetical protein
MNIVKKLHSIASANYQNEIGDAQRNLDSVKANLQMEDDKDKDMLKFFGTKEVIVAQTERSTNAKARFAEGVVSEDDIKTVCYHYALRFLPATFYKKEIPLQALNDLRKFKNENKLSDDQLHLGLNIIAPASHFTLGKRPKKDPILLYKSGYESYKVVSTWGNDFNFFRRMWGAIYFIHPIFPPLLAVAVAAIIAITIHPAYLALLIVLLPMAAAYDLRGVTIGEKWNEPYK